MDAKRIDKAMSFLGESRASTFNQNCDIQMTFKDNEGGSANQGTSTNRISSSRDW